MIKVNTHAAKTQLSKLLTAVEKNGEVVQICRAGVPIAELHPVVAMKLDPFKLHPVLSKIEFYADPMLPLDPEDWPDPPDFPDPT